MEAALWKTQEGEMKSEEEASVILQKEIILELRLEEGFLQIKNRIPGWGTTCAKARWIS